MHTRGAIDLSINIIIIIIISLVILGLGVTLLFSFITGAEDIKLQLDARTDAELERLLVNQGEMVSLPFHVATIERGDNRVFVLGILNIDPAAEQFFIIVELSKALDEEMQEITPLVKEQAESWLLYEADALPLREHEHRKEAILVNPSKDALKGQYIYKARVYSNNVQYGNTQTFIVNVR